MRIKRQIVIPNSRQAFETTLQRIVERYVIPGREVTLVRASGTVGNVWERLRSRIGQAVTIVIQMNLTNRRISSVDFAVAGSLPTPPAAQSEEALRIIRRDGLYLILNREAYREEVSDYLFGQGFDATPEELWSPESDLHGHGPTIVLPHERWQISPVGVVPPFRRLTPRPAVQRLIDALPDDSIHRQPPPPESVPEDVWNAFLRETAPRAYRYQHRSRWATDIILLRDRDGYAGGYVEMPTDTSRLQAMLHVTPSFLERLANLSPQSVRLQQEANRKFNVNMWERVSHGVRPREAYRDYSEQVDIQFREAYIQLIEVNGALR